MEIVIITPTTRPELRVEITEIKEAIVNTFEASAMFMPSTEVIIPPIPAWVQF